MCRPWLLALKQPYPIAPIQMLAFESTHQAIASHRTLGAHHLRMVIRQFSTNITTPTTINLNGEVAITQYLYIPPSPSTGLIEQATLESNGRFNTYASTPNTSISWYPTGIAFATANNTTRAYVSSLGLTSGVFMCDFSPQGNGAFNSCTLQPFDNWHQPRDIAFATSSGIQYAYFPDYVEGNLYMHKYSLNPNSGTLENCGGADSQDSAFDRQWRSICLCQ